MAVFSQNRNKFILSAVMIVLSLIFVGKILHNSVYIKYTERENEYTEKMNYIDKYKNVIKEIETVRGKDKALKKLFSDVQEKMIRVNSKSIAAVKLQEKIKELANNASINIASYKDLDSFGTVRYLKVGGEIITKCKMRELNDFLYIMQKSNVYLTVSEMNIKNINDPQGVVHAILKIFTIADISSQEGM